MRLDTLTRRAGLYWHTVKYLRPVQIYGRLWFRLARPALDTSPSPALRLPSGQWIKPAQRRQSLVGEGQFYFLHQSGSLEQLGWDDAATEILWRYNQHYFDDLNAVAAPERQAWHHSLLQNWLAQNPPGRGTGWEPYPTSLRIVNWIKWSLAGNVLAPHLLHSLAMQTRWLCKRLEIHLLGNHLFANAKALIFAGLFFEGHEAEKWLTKGLGIVARELPEQVLEDGGNFERSPMYHSIFFEDVLDLINIAQAWPQQIDVTTADTWRHVAQKMHEWLVGMTHPDGQIGLFNDAAFNVTPKPAELADYAARLGLPVAERQDRSDRGATNRYVSVKHWPISGYIRLESPSAVALLDVAPIGPDYLPSHANADTLSFELSLFGQRIVVNGGTSRYGLGPERLSERQTAAHSTVELDGLSSSEVWGGFRAARRAYPIDLRLDQTADQVRVACAHTGYRHLPGQPTPERTWDMTAASLRVTDRVTGGFREMVARYHFHPRVQVSATSATTYLLTLEDNRSVKLAIESGSGALIDAKYAEEFGNSVTIPCLRISSNVGTIAVRLEWAAD